MVVVPLMDPSRYGFEVEARPGEPRPWTVVHVGTSLDAGSFPTRDEAVLWAVRLGRVWDGWKTLSDPLDIPSHVIEAINERTETCTP